MGRSRYKAREMVAQAMEETGSTNPMAISFKLEDYVVAKIRTRQNPQESQVWNELARMGVATIGDIQRLINELVEAEKPETKRRGG